MVDELAQLPGHLSEIILHPEHSPRLLLEAVVGGKLGRVGLSVLSVTDASGQPDTWTSVVEQMHAHPPGDDMDTWVMFIDPSSLAAVSDAVTIYNEETGETTFGPLVSQAWADKVGEVHPLWARAMAAWLWEPMKGLRAICEETGLRVIVITADLRPMHAMGSTVLPTHRFRDARVRSFIGDAGRYWCHARYLPHMARWTFTRPARTVPTHELDVKGRPTFREFVPREKSGIYVDRIVVVKDEAEGEPGRIIFQAARPRLQNVRSLRARPGRETPGVGRTA